MILGERMETALSEVPTTCRTTSGRAEWGEEMIAVHQTLAG